VDDNPKQPLSHPSQTASSIERLPQASHDAGQHKHAWEVKFPLQPAPDGEDSFFRLPSNRRQNKLANATCQYQTDVRLRNT
jgi:hypothetical protein